MSLLMKRQSVRHYTKETVSEVAITTMLEAAMQAPSANNQQPWEFIIVDDRTILDQLSKASRGAWMLADAPLAIIVVMKEGGKSPRMRPQDCAAAVENILLSAVEQQLGAVWIGVYPLEERMTYINEILHITKGTAFAQIAIGHPDTTKSVTKRYDASRVYRNTME
ncbi:nitroreductase family protein [Candidatus Xianfuyuplasma coldseepsis]|uniref:Nitroreductase family protein n=1 Tax=Candidatus Xianfuyuplasma coldseepsis TaxID=2782163 RepID=A0A7L7KTH7_9MOLU|nr:nitroreductase family protein [Xianfuyuplasma coldseepsis]QMS85546.1 nitroreductase family protein [Xianfuyuplasma coldseepsis]